MSSAMSSGVVVNNDPTGSRQSSVETNEPILGPSTLVDGSRHSSVSLQSDSSEVRRAKSPGPKVCIVPRHGSFEERDSFRRIKTGPPTNAAQQPKKIKGPASRTTVVTVAGLFCVSILFLTSGTIVLCTDHNNAQPQMRHTAMAFIGIGLLMLLACGLLQRKNWVRYMDQMDEDLYFLRLGKNPVWNLMKLDMLDFKYMSYTRTGKGSGRNGDRGSGADDSPSNSPVPEVHEPDATEAINQYWKPDKY